MTSTNDLPWGDQLRQWREGHDLSRSDLCRSLKVEVARDSDSREVSPDEKLIYTWESGRSKRGPQGVYRRALARMGAPLPNSTLTSCNTRKGEIEPARDKSFPARPADSRTSTDPIVAELCSSIAAYREDHTEKPLPELRGVSEDLNAAFLAYQDSRFTIAASRATTLLADIQNIGSSAERAENAESSRLLALSYHLVSSVLVKFGHADLALMAADRGYQIARHLESVAARLSLTRAVAFTLLANGRQESAMELIDNTAGSMTGTQIRTDKDASVAGTLFLVGSLAAARFGDRARANDYLREADFAARRLGCDANFAWTAFGPTNVLIHRVNVAAELDDMQTVINALPPENLDSAPLERQVRYSLDIARALSAAGRATEATETLLIAERRAPEHVRRHHLSRKVTEDLIRAANHRPPVELRLLAQRMQVREPIA